MKKPKLLIVEDNEASLFGYTRYLTKEGYAVQSAISLKEAREAMQSEVFDVVLLDLGLPDGNGLDWIEELRMQHESVAIIVITGLSDVPTAVKSMRLGADNYLTKPVNMDDLNIAIQKSLEIEQLRKRNSVHQRLAQQGEPYFGKSEAIATVMNFAEVAASNNTVVLLHGETGTGKGVLARWIHGHSDRRSEAFVELNCSSLKGELLRSELFGHAKGAFTSAIKDRAGLIEAADGGTLFLDEIGDMDLDVQAQLLKTIEERSYRRIGENKLRSSDFRLVCATNRDLTKATNDGEFRKDLYYRICVFPIHIPPLRERPEELEDLGEHLLASFAYDSFPLKPEVVELLKEYDWPGNIRELKNMLERALLLAQGRELQPEHFPGLVPSAKIAQPTIETGNQQVWSLDDIERSHIIKALKHFQGDKYKTSSALGISLASLYRKLGKIQNPA
ncbi:MAG: sigma-54-dependent transcriptional regulator [Chitinivibrionales bacterium]